MSEPPPDLPRRVRRLYSADDIRRDVLGEESEPPPGLVTLKPPVGAVPSFPNLTPAITGVLRLPEAQAGIDLARIAAPQIERMNAQMQQAIAPMLLQASGSIGAALEPMKAVLNASVALQMAGFGEMFGRINAMLVDWAESFRPFGALAAPSIAVDTLERWRERNPVFGLAFEVRQQAPGWEDSLDALARRPEFSPMSAERGRNPEILSRIDAYRDGQISNSRLGIVRVALLDALLNMPHSVPVHEFLPYLQKAVQNALHGNQFPLLPGLPLLGTGKTRCGRPVGSKEYWSGKADFVGAVTAAIRALEAAGRIITQERVHEYLAGHMAYVARPHNESGYGLRQFQRDREDFGFSDWQALRDFCMN